MPPKAKKALAFLKSAPKAPLPTFDWDDDATKKDDDQCDSLDLFKRSKHFFPIIVEEQEQEKRPRNSKSEEATTDKKNDFEDDEEATPGSSRSSKRRRLSSKKAMLKTDDPFAETHDDLYGPATPPHRVSDSPSSRRAKPKLETESPRSNDKGKGKETLAPLKGNSLPTPSRSNSYQQPEDHVIALDEDPFDDDAPAKRTVSDESPSKKDGLKSDAIILDDSDDDIYVSAPEPEKEDEFAHFIREAAEKEAAALAAAEACLNVDDAANANTDVFGASKSGPKGPRKGIAIKVFVQSRLNTDLPPKKDTFGAKRLLDQNLGPVRKSYILWLRKHGVEVSETMERDLFLTWKRRRIYDSSSGLSLGWQPNTNGDLSTISDHRPGFSRGGALLEAWTPEIFEECMAEEERQKMLKRGELLDETDASDRNDENGGHEANHVQKIRVLLQEKDKEALKMTVGMDTPFRIVVGAYRKQRNVPVDVQIKLRYEGDWLTEQMTLEDADVDEMTTIEVYLR